MPEIKIKISEENCSAVYTDCLLEKIGSKIKNKKCGKKVLILSDDNVFPLYGDTVKRAVREEGKETVELVLAHGEATKNFSEVYRILEACGKNKMSRDDTILTLGGGVVSDIGGFAASVYMRGVNFAAVPTTLLAQVDAAIGGKTGVNLPFGKNLAGSFYQPSFVYIDLNTLKSLPQKEVRQGLAEIIKYGVIKSRKIFDVMSKDMQDIKSHYGFLVSESINIKKKVVEKDEKEKKGLREILNFGHTLGHAVEISHFPQFSHGEAVSLGMVGESYISFRLGICRKDTYEKIVAAVRKNSLPFSYAGIKRQQALQFLSYDKKVRQGKIRFVLPEKIGSVKRGITVSVEEAGKIIKEIARDERP